MRFAPILLAALAPITPQSVVPAMQAKALDGHRVQFPRDLVPATVLVLSFSRDATPSAKAWAVCVQTKLARKDSIAVYSMPMLAEVPAPLRPMVVRAIRNQVPEAAQGTFVPLNDHEEEWKHLAGYDAHAGNAAYVVLLDREGHVQWSTHEVPTEANFLALSERAKVLASAR